MATAKKQNKCLKLFFHKTINISAESVQEVLFKNLPSFHEWRIYQLDKKCQKLILNILELVETDDEEADPRLSLVFYPEYEWMENQTVFISFNTERMKEDRVTVEVDKRLIEATKVNPYTFLFICKDVGAFGHQCVKVYLNEDVAFTSRVFLKDRNHILLDEISKMDSPLYYLQSILKKIKYNEGALALPTIETKILEGTKHLLKRLYEIPDDDSDTDITEEKGGHYLKIEDEPCQIKKMGNPNTKLTPVDLQSDDTVRRSNSPSIRCRRRGLQRKDFGLSVGYSKHQSERVSRVLQKLNFEDIPAITVNPELKKFLTEDFFDSIDFN